MQRIVIIFIFLCTTLTIVYAQGVQYKEEKNARILQLTKDGKFTDLTQSPDGEWFVFVKKSNYIIPSNCFTFRKKVNKLMKYGLLTLKK